MLDRLPQREQSEAKDLLRAVVYAPSRAEAVKAREVFARRYRPWYPKAVDVLEDDWDRMVTFYDFPEAHWKHLRTTNVVESPFASVRPPHVGSKTIQARRQCYRPHLEAPHGGGETLQKARTLHTCSRTCLEKGSSGTESPSQTSGARPPPDSFTHLLTRPRPPRDMPILQTGACSKQRRR